MSGDSTKLAIGAVIDDLALVRGCKDGDVSAFEELIKRYDVKLLRIALHIAHNREDAEEVVQDTFLKAYLKLDQFEERASFSTWLTRIAVNESLLKLRKHRATTDRWISLTPTGDGIPLDVADWAPNPEQRYSATELRATLIKCLEGLSPALRVVFVLRDIAGLSGDETAEVLGLALPAVKARLLRARLQLREKLSKHFRRPVVANRPFADERVHPPRSERSPVFLELSSTSTTENQKIGSLLTTKWNDDERVLSAVNELLTQS